MKANKDLFNGSESFQNYVRSLVTSNSKDIEQLNWLLKNGISAEPLLKIESTVLEIDKKLKLLKSSTKMDNIIKMINKQIGLPGKCTGYFAVGA